MAGNATAAIKIAERSQFTLEDSMEVPPAWAEICPVALHFITFAVELQVSRRMLRRVT